MCILHTYSVHILTYNRVIVVTIDHSEFMYDTLYYDNPTVFAYYFLILHNFHKQNRILILLYLRRVNNKDFYAQNRY